MSKLSRFLRKIGIEPRDMSLYSRALTHISAARNYFDSYERLEFLGDSIIGMVVGEFLFGQFPEKEEGELSRIRAMVVSGETLGAKALELGLDRFLRADTVRVREGEQAELSILADCFEATVGAVFADRGYRHARSFVLRHLRDECLKLKEMVGPSDDKSRLQELWQQRYKEPPEYVVASEKGPDHDKVFTVEVRYKGRVLGKGTGSSKKRAEQEAAHKAMAREMAKEKRKSRRRPKSE
jgi:ribonuclease-3